MNTVRLGRKMRKITSALMLLIACSICIAGQPEIKSKKDFMSDSDEVCRDDWTKRGDLDLDMYKFCMKQKEESYKEIIEYTSNKKSKYYSNKVLSYCLNEWTKRDVSDTEMIAYCLSQEVEGMKDIEYLRKKYGPQKVDDIYLPLLSEYGSWSTAAYWTKDLLKQ